MQESLLLAAGCRGLIMRGLPLTVPYGPHDLRTEVRALEPVFDQLVEVNSPHLGLCTDIHLVAAHPKVRFTSIVILSMSMCSVCLCPPCVLCVPG